MRLFSLIFLSLMLLSGCDSQPTPLTIVHTNDVHAHLLPSDAKLQDCDVDNADCLGGYARIKSVIDGIRQTSDNVVVVDAGDRFSGTVFYTLRKSQDVTPLTEQIGYDVLTLGNHEFDDGLVELFKFAQGISAPIVSANVSFPTHTQLNERIVPSVILNKNGLKIGVIGALSEETKLESSKAKEIDIVDVIPAVRREAEKLTRQGVKVLIALTHIGIEADKDLARAVPELDIIVGGHTHTLLSNNHEENTAYGPYPIVISGVKKAKTLIVTSGIGGHHLGILNAAFDKKGHIVSYAGDTVRLDTTIVPNNAMEQSVALVQQSVDKIINEPILHIDQDIYLTNNGKYCSESCYVGEFLTESFDLHDGLSRFLIVDTDDGYVLFAVFHHIIFDALSDNVFKRDLQLILDGEVLDVDDSFLKVAAYAQQISQTEDYVDAENFYDSMLADSGEVGVLLDSVSSDETIDAEI